MAFTVHTKSSIDRKRTDVRSCQYDIFNSYTKPLLLGKQLLIFLKISVKLAVLSFDIMIIYI